MGSLVRSRRTQHRNLQLPARLPAQELHRKEVDYSGRSPRRQRQLRRRQQRPLLPRRLEHFRWVETRMRRILVLQLPVRYAKFVPIPYTHSCSAPAGGLFGNLGANKDKKATASSLFFIFHRGCLFLKSLAQRRPQLLHSIFSVPQKIPPRRRTVPQV